MSPGRTIIALVSLAVCAPAHGDEWGSFALRNLHPFLHIYGLPVFQSARLAAPGSADYRISVTAVNNAEIGERLPESIVLDGESWFADFSVRQRVAERLELGIDVPFVSHSGGVLDGAIVNWHEIWGLSNSKRSGPDGLLSYRYEDDGIVVDDVSSAGLGLGDIQLTAAVPLLVSDVPREQQVAVRFSVKLPTGDPDQLHGSGATDAALGIYGRTATSVFGQAIALHGFAGAIAIGDSKVLSGKQHSVVPFGGAAVTWFASNRFAFSAQLHAQGPYVESALEDLGDGTLQLAFGAIYRPSRNGVSLRFAVIEDLLSDAAPDFGLHFALQVAGGD